MSGSSVVKTPCTGLCSTVYGDVVCRGCKRFHHEVVGWNAYNAPMKQAVWQRLEYLLCPLAARHFQVRDEVRLRQQMMARGIALGPQQSPYWGGYQLIVKGARLIQQLEAYGLELLPSVAHLSLPEVRDQLDQAFFHLSVAHYERYIAPKFAQRLCAGQKQSCDNQTTS